MNILYIYFAVSTCKIFVCRSSLRCTQNRSILFTEAGRCLSADRSGDTSRYLPGSDGEYISLCSPFIFLYHPLSIKLLYDLVLCYSQYKTTPKYTSHDSILYRFKAEGHLECPCCAVVVIFYTIMLSCRCVRAVGRGSH